MRPCPAIVTLRPRMNRTRPAVALESPVEAGKKLNRQLLWITSALALASLLIVLLETLTAFQMPGKPSWPEAVLVCLTTFATLAALTRHLPAQNVLLAAAIVAVIGGAAHLLAVVYAVPFGPLHFTDEFGPRLFDKLGWAMPLIWIVAVLNSRGVARLILRPWRKIRAYGFWLIAITAVLAVLFDAACEPFATRVNHYWFWLPTKLPFTWYGAPVSNFAGWLLISVLILAFAAPALIKKNQRPKKSRPDYHPLIV